MALQLSAYVITNPAFIEPEFLVQYSQASGFTDTLAGKALRVKIAEDDLFVYMKQINLRTRMLAGAASPNELPTVDISTQMLNTPTYLFKARAAFDHHDVAAANRWGFSAVEAYRLGLRQGHNQLARDAALKGMNPQNGEGLINAQGATAVILPPDPNGNTTATSYDNGAMAFFLMQQIQQLKTRTLQMGIGREFTILGPQRTLGLFEYNVVQLTQFQREGAGTASTAQTLEQVLMKNKDKLTWAYDDTLIGAGSGGTDMVILIMPELAKPEGRGPTNTNVFADLTPGSPVNFTQYADMAAPREIMSPMAGGATDFLTEWRVTSGWPVRPTAITLISIPYP